MGLATLTLASLAAFLERDGKKVVALSTLSQLGLIVLALSLGNLTICLFHVVTHALAKANLFLVVGNFLHRGLSQQDTRKLSLIGLSRTILLGIIVRILRLSGFLFTSGFFSKEQVIGFRYLSLNRSRRILVLVLLSRLTLGYCLKLLYSLVSLRNFSFLSLEGSLYASLPVLVLRRLRLLAGFRLFFNVERGIVLTKRLVRVY